MKQTEEIKTSENLIISPPADTWHLFTSQYNQEIRTRTIEAINGLKELNISEAEPLLNKTVFTDSPALLAGWYNAFSAFLEASPEHHRLILYFPFSWLPAKSWLLKADPELAKAWRCFLEIYLQTWRQILLEIDFRNDFYNGDLLESDYGIYQNARVAKAGHLLPMLLEKHLINEFEVSQLIMTSARPETIESLTEGLRAYAQLQATSRQISENIFLSWPEILEEIAQEVDFGYRQILNPGKSITVSRFNWERELVVDRAIARQVKNLKHLSKVEFIASYYHDSRLEPVWVKLQLQLRALGVPGQESWPTGRELPRLLASGSFSEDNLGLDWSQKLQLAADKIDASLELSKFIYPVVVMYGSRVKGYAVSPNDADLAIFVRPGVDSDRREEIQKIWSENFSHIFFGKPLEFWLTNYREGLYISSGFNDKLSASKDSIHVLLGGAWCGPIEAIESLQDKLLPWYFSEKREASKRRFWLKILERDFLQYRLLHKGYNHFFPAEGKIRTAQISEIDSDCAFWDEGYRQLATELFVRKVFLPKI